MSDSGNGRVPPNDLDAEGAVLSAILLDARALDQVPFLEPKHFYATANSRIYEAVQALHSEGRPVDVISVAGFLRDRERLMQVGGTPYLAQLADATPAVAHVENHAKTVVGKWEVRQVIYEAQRIATEGYGDIGIIDDWKQSVDTRMFAVARSLEREDRLVHLGDATRDAWKVIVERSQRTGVVISGCPTGLPTLDARIGGLEGTKLYVLAARPGMGKTAAATGWVLSAAKSPEPNNPDAIGDGVVFVSVEMPRQQIAMRVYSQLSRIDSVKLRLGKLSREEWQDLAVAQAKAQKLPIVIEDSSNHTPASIRAAFRMGQRRLQDKFGKKLRVRLCAVDYLQLLNTDGDNREQEIAAISRGMKAMAKDEDIATLALAQVNRDCEKRPDKRPLLGDLRESGAIEQDADSVIFIYRHDVYRPKDEEKDDKAEFIVSKLRDNGGPGVVHVLFNPKTMSFYEQHRNPDMEQLGDMFDEYIDGTYGEKAPMPNAPHWTDDDD